MEGEMHSMGGLGRVLQGRGTDGRLELEREGLEARTPGFPALPGYGREGRKGAGPSGSAGGWGEKAGRLEPLSLHRWEVRLSLSWGGGRRGRCPGKVATDSRVLFPRRAEESAHKSQAAPSAFPRPRAAIPAAKGGRRDPSTPPPPPPSNFHLEKKISPALEGPSRLLFPGGTRKKEPSPRFPLHAPLGGWRIGPPPSGNEQTARAAANPS